MVLVVVYVPPQSSIKFNFTIQNLLIDSLDELTTILPVSNIVLCSDFNSLDIEPISRSII